MFNVAFIWIYSDQRLSISLRGFYLNLTNEIDYLMYSGNSYNKLSRLTERN